MVSNGMIESVEQPKKWCSNLVVVEKPNDCQRAVVYKLLQVIDVALQFESGRNNPISPMLQLLIALSYYATGSFQIIEGDLCAVSSLDRQIVTT
ncbi:hypothetical protein M8J77_006860 [Diaphorina citri]|nr:hypothetical protein M8J77_006860 [Diaphorina citri]